MNSNKIPPKNINNTKAYIIRKGFLYFRLEGIRLAMSTKNVELENLVGLTVTKP